MNMDKVVCHCMNITNGMFKDAVEAGAKTLEDVQEQTGATTVYSVESGRRHTHKS